MVCFISSQQHAVNIRTNIWALYLTKIAEVETFSQPRKFPFNMKVSQNWKIMLTQVILWFLNWNSSCPGCRKVVFQFSATFEVYRRGKWIKLCSSDWNFRPNTHRTKLFTSYSCTFRWNESKNHNFWFRRTHSIDKIHPHFTLVEHTLQKWNPLVYKFKVWTKFTLLANENRNHWICNIALNQHWSGHDISVSVSPHVNGQR